MFSTKKEKIDFGNYMEFSHSLDEVPLVCNYGINLDGLDGEKWWNDWQLNGFSAVDWALEANQWWFLEAFNNNNSRAPDNALSPLIKYFAFSVCLSCLN